MSEAETATVEEVTEAAKKKGGVAALSVGRGNIYRLAPADINVKPGFNSRVKDFDENDAEDIALARSIAENGVKNPVSVFVEEGVVYLSDGHRRKGAIDYALANLLDIAKPKMLDSVPVIVEETKASEADRIAMQITRNSSKPLTAMEQAEVFKKLKATGLNENDIATKTGLSVQRIRDLLDLVKQAPAAVKKMIARGDISPTLAIQTLKKAKGDGKKAGELLDAAVGKAKSEGKAKATAKHVPEVKPDNPKVRLRAIFSELTFTESGEDYSVKMSADEYAEIRGLIGF